MKSWPCRLSCVTFAGGMLALAPAWAREHETPLELEPPDACWQGAIGPLAGDRPASGGAAQQQAKARPALFLRYARFTATNASGFVSQRADDVVPGRGAGWLLIGSGSPTRLLARAADCLPAKNRNGWGLNLGLARRF